MARPNFVLSSPVYVARKHRESAWFYTSRVPATRKRRIGLLGGTFDPPHRGHLAAAAAVRAELGLDEVWFVVANDPWQKSGERAVTPAPVRLEMVVTAIAGHEGYRIDDREVLRGGPTYTVDTLEEIRGEHDDVDLYLIVGQDTAQKISSTWHRSDDVFALSTLVVVTRPGTQFNKSVVPEGSVFVEMTPVDVSSSRVREAISRGESLGDATPDAVVAFIREHGLYGGAQ